MARTTVDPALIGYEHTVMAWHPERDLLAINMLGTPGLARVEAYKDKDDNEVSREIAATTLRETWAHYRIGEQEFKVPLGTNVGPMIPVAFYDESGERIG